MTIFVGAVFGGPEIVESAVSTAITKVGLLFAERRPKDSEGREAALNIVFHVPGSLSSVDWEGVLAAKFSKKRKLLLIQAAVPARMVSSENIGPFLCELMRQGVVAAKPVFEKAGIPFDEAKCTEYVTAIERELGWRR